MACRLIGKCRFNFLAEVGLVRKSVSTLRLSRSYQTVK
jgi:hypothetical protein